MIYLAIVLVNLLLNLFIKNASILNNIINPLYWIIFSIALMFVLPQKYINKKKDNRMTQTSAVVALIYIVIYTLFGLIVTFGRNPYSVTIKGILINFWVTGLVIIGREYIRYKIISNTKHKDIILVSILTVVLFSILEIDIQTFIGGFGNASSMFRQIVSNILPIIVKNVLFTYMAQKYSYKPAIAYQIIINMFYWISPILPNSPWILIAILDTVIPFLFFVIVSMRVDDKEIALGRVRKEKTDVKGTITFGVAVALLACFATGLFPIEPKAVATASMYPAISVGDVALIKKCGINDVDIGDVIEYQLENQFIIHRIIKKEVKDGEVVIITQGDNNSSPDAKPVTKEQVIGKVIFNAKYLGIPSVWINRLMGTNDEVLVETGK